MPAPSEIVDALESVVDIFLSNIRHRERAAFILCDNLVEMACKTKAKQNNRNFNLRCNFHDAWNAPGVNLPSNGLGGRVQNRRETRNLMQHANAAVTVDTQACADAILDAVKVIDRLWRNTSRRAFRDWLKVAIRIVRLYSQSGDPQMRQRFEMRMRNESWRDFKRPARVREMIIEPGLRQHWGIVVKHNPSQVEQILNELQIP